jgi:hypothetical protein
MMAVAARLDLRQGLVIESGLAPPIPLFLPKRADVIEPAFEQDQ